MKPDVDERQHSESAGAKPANTLLIVAAVLAIIALLYFIIDRQRPAEIPPPVANDVNERALLQQALPPALDIPELAPSTQSPETERALPPPTLESSDTDIRAQLAPTGDAVLLSKVLQSDNLVQRAVTVVNGLNRGYFARKALPVPPPAAKFAVLTRDGQLMIDPNSYNRYDAYANGIADLDTAALASTFHRYRPLLEHAYAELGNAPEDLDNSVIRSLDAMLAAPEVEHPILLKRHEAVYHFEDPKLESLSSLQKQLLRMGPENTRKIKLQAQALRNQLLHESD